MIQIVIQNCAAGLSAILSLSCLLYMVLGTLLGIMVGAIPGFTSALAVGILLPVTYFMEPVEAMIFLISIYVSSIYGGSITAILLNAPGTPESSATTFDGFEMTKRGRASEALGISFGASCLGGIFSYICMLFFMSPIANFALKFGPLEMFLLAMLGVSMLAAVGDASVFKVFMAGAFGLLVGTIGISSTGEWRCTFGSLWLADGIQVIPCIIGLFAMSEMFSMLQRPLITGDREDAASAPASRNSMKRIIKSMATPLKYPVTLIKSMIIGTVVGAIPAAGGSMAALTSYAEARRSSKHSELFGTGCEEGIVAPESANNACTGGALMTSLALGVPGSTTCALLLSALMVQGLNPGPSLVTQQIDLVYGIIIAAIVSQVLMLVMSVLIGSYSVNLLNINTSYLVPVVSCMCMMGTYAIRRSLFDVGCLLVFGILGYIMKRYGYPPVAIVLGLVMAGIADQNLSRARMLFGESWLNAIFTRPIAAVLLAIIVLVFIFQIYQQEIKPRLKGKSFWIQ